MAKTKTTAKPKPKAAPATKPQQAPAKPQAAAAQPTSDPSSADNRAAWTSVHPALLVLTPTASSPLRGNLQLAALTALRVATYVARPEVRAGFEKLASVGLFNMAHLDGLALAARAALYASHRYKLTLGSQSDAKIPQKLDAHSAELRGRMFSVAEHNLSDDADIVRRINVIRPGTGYIDRANDLVGLADIYHDRPDAVRLDGKHFRAGDEADARATAAQIFEALGLGAVVDGIDWYAEQHLTWVNLDTIYSQIARWGHALDGTSAADDLYPDLRGASRAAWGSVSRAAATEDPPKPPTG